MNEHSMRRLWWLALAALTGLAALLRLYQLDGLPAGLHIDEAAEGLMALQILAGARPVFFSAYTGQEAGYMYLVAAAIAGLGRTILAVRLPAALAGVALIPLLALLARRPLGPWAALLVAGAAATSPWLQHLNRIGFRANLLPLALCLWVLLLLRALEQPRRSTWAAAGAVLGLSAYTYLAARLVPLLVLLFLAYLAVWQRPLLSRCRAGLGLMVGLATLLALPLVWHFFAVPSDWGNRLDQVGACAGGVPVGTCLQRVAANTLATVAMVAWRGDPKPFYNEAQQPAILLGAGWLFYLGLALALRRWREPAWALALLWWAVMIVPGLLSSENPSFIRTLGAAPPVMLLWALPLARLGQLAAPAGWHRQAVRAGLGGGLIAALALALARSYFGSWAINSDRYYDFHAYAVDAARAAGAVPAGSELAISEEYYRHATYLYLEPRTAMARWFDARGGWPLPSGERPSVAFVPITTPLEGQLAAALLPAASGQSYANGRGQYAYTRFGRPAEPLALPAPTLPLRVAFDAVALDGLTLVPPGEASGLALALHWQVRQATQQELRAFVHLLDQRGEKVAQYDAIGYHSLEWRPGDRFLSFHPLMPQLPPPGTYTLLIGLYDANSGVRSPLAQPGAPTELRLSLRVAPDGQVVLATV